MTDKEALSYLRNSYGDGSMGFANLVSTRAIKQAIEALEKQTRGFGDKAYKIWVIPKEDV